MHDGVFQENWYLILERLKDAGIIEEITKRTLWCAPMAPVLKKSGAVRICVDLKRLNLGVERERYIQPKLQDLTSILAGAIVFSPIDAASGFDQIPLHEASQELTILIMSWSLLLSPPPNRNQVHARDIHAENEWISSCTLTVCSRTWTTSWSTEKKKRNPAIGWTKSSRSRRLLDLNWTETSQSSDNPIWSVWCERDTLLPRQGPSHSWNVVAIVSLPTVWIISDHSCQIFMRWPSDSMIYSKMMLCGFGVHIRNNRLTPSMG